MREPAGEEAIETKKKKNKKKKTKKQKQTKQNNNNKKKYMPSIFLSRMNWSHHNFSPRPSAF